MAGVWSFVISIGYISSCRRSECWVVSRLERTFVGELAEVRDVHKSLGLALVDGDAAQLFLQRIVR